MSLTRRHFASLLMATTVACVESPMEPGQLHQLPAISAKLVLPPGATPASFGLVLDTVTVLIEQFDSTFCDCSPPIDTVFVNSKIAWPSNQESIQLRVDVPEPPLSHVIYVYLSYSSRGVVMFQGSSLVDFRRGDIRLPVIPMYYFGPGYLSDDIQLFPGDTAMAPGDTLQFKATAFQLALPLDTAYISWRVSDSTKAKIDHLGRLTLRPGALGSTFNVLASIPSGVVSSSRVSVPNVVVALQKVSGDSQNTPVGQRSTKPLTVRAVDAGGKPVAGARIRFFPTVPATVAVPDSVIFTDGQGLARSGPIPIILGNVTVRGQVTGAAKQIDFTVTGTAAGAYPPLLFASDSGANGWQLHRADTLGGNRIILGYLGSSGLEWTSPHWNYARTRVAYTSHSNVTANFDLRITTAIGDTTATLVTDTYGSGARFSPTGKILAFACGNLASDISGYVCTLSGVDGAVGTLNNTGNGAGRTEVTAVVPGRLNGPIAFAWRPDASTRIAFVRDTASTDLLSPWQSSRIYQTNADGTALTALSPKVMDLGNGPLLVHGTMDWAPDGSTIVFSATDTTFAGQSTRSLYALDVATGNVRRLTTPAGGWIGDLHPHFSPDGQRILFYRTYYGGSDYFVVRVTGGSPSRITWAANTWAGGDPFYLGGDWAPDGRSVIVAAPNGLGGKAAYVVPLDTQDQVDYLARRRLVGTAGIVGLRDLAVSWGP